MSCCCHSFTGIHVANGMEEELPCHCDVVLMETHLEIEELKQALNAEINTMKEASSTTGVLYGLRDTLKLYFLSIKSVHLVAFGYNKLGGVSLHLNVTKENMH
ncbi:hypothetical protein L1887_14459 [Cichorium endivia]|nr:hypothetical protein L1887_14459 [Cichorium endivia]